MKKITNVLLVPVALLMTVTPVTAYAEESVQSTTASQEETTQNIGTQITTPLKSTDVVEPVKPV